MKTMRIGELASCVKITTDAIRFYEKAGLLPVPSRNSGGYREYTAKDIETLLFVKRVQELGFSLREVKDFLVLQEKKPDCCAEVRDLFREKLEAIKQKQKQLKRLEMDIGTSLKRCERQLKLSTRKHERCEVLQQLRSMQSQE